MMNVHEKTIAGWMDGWMEGGREGWRDGGTEGRRDGWMDGWMDGWVDATYIAADQGCKPFCRVLGFQALWLGAEGTLHF